MPAGPRERDHPTGQGPVDLSPGSSGSSASRTREQLRTPGLLLKMQMPGCLVTVRCRSVPGRDLSPPPCLDPAAGSQPPWAPGPTAGTTFCVPSVLGQGQRHTARAFDRHGPIRSCLEEDRGCPRGRPCRRRQRGRTDSEPLSRHIGGLPGAQQSTESRWVTFTAESHPGRREGTSSSWERPGAWHPPRRCRSVTP